ncbi:hypothetical protein D3C81_527740 [compost metagenome]
MPYNYLTTSGVIVADTSTLKSEVQAEYVDAFGPTMLLADDSPQGRLIDTEVTARDGIMRLAAELANQINPNLSSGIYLESICALHAVLATGESFTVVPGVVLGGTIGTIIPSGSRIADQAGNFYRLVSQVTIGPGGTVSVDAQATAPGPLNPATGQITTIVDGVLGWLTVTNPNPVLLPGTIAESDNALREARNRKLSRLGKGSVEAIYSNAFDVDNVRSLSVRENTEPATTVIDGVTLTPNSTWVCVQGGVAADVAQALLASKQTGSPWTTGVSNGTPVFVSIPDPISGQVYPIIFTTPTAVPIAVRVTVAAGSTIDAPVVIPNAVLNYANGLLPGEPGFVCGASVSPFEMASAINIQYPELFIKKVELGTIASGPVFTVAEIPIALWEVATVTSGNISVVVV